MGDKKLQAPCGFMEMTVPLITAAVIIIIIFKGFIYLFMRHRQREAETQAEGEAGSMQGARCGTRSRVSRIMPRAAGGAKPLCHRGCPVFCFKCIFKILMVLPIPLVLIF